MDEWLDLPDKTSVEKGGKASRLGLGLRFEVLFQIWVEVFQPVSIPAKKGAVNPIDLSIGQ